MPKTGNTTRVLFMAASFAQANAVRDVFRTQGSSTILEIVWSRDALRASLKRQHPDVLILDHSVGIDRSMLGSHPGPHDKSLEWYGSGRLPLILIGVSSAEEARLALSYGVNAALRDSDLDQLPFTVENPPRSHGPERAQEPSDFAALSGIRSAEALRENQKMVTIGRLTASIAHEINNPLESITNLLFLVGMDTRLSTASRNYLEMAQHELGRVVQISTQTLNFYRETASPMRLDLSELLEEVLVLYARRIGDKRLVVTKEYDARTPVTVFPGEMRQVFSNLVSNAIEASRQGGKLRLRIRNATHWSDGEVKGVRVSVADDGSGIDPQIRRRIGEAFFTTKGQRGTGLGLWVTQSILQRYGGNLELHSTVTGPKHGTVFSVFLPTNLRPSILPPLAGSAAMDPSHEGWPAEQVPAVEGVGAA